MDDQVQCPVCGAACESRSGEHIDDDTLFICTTCGGGYRLPGTAERLFETGKLKKPDPKAFRKLVKSRRGKSKEYPVITQYDIERIL